MESNEISVHEARVYKVLVAAADEWLTNKEIAVRAGIANRTARAHTLKLVSLGIIDRAEVFPGHRFKISPKAESRNTTYLQRLQDACTILGVE